jgi:hypothetical protein
MDWKTPAILSLLLLAAAAAPPDCQPDAASGQAMPIPLDLAGRPNIQSGLTDQTFTTLPGSLGNNGCRDATLPAIAPPSTLRNDTGDALHGLPMPDSLRPIDQPKRAPDFE